jgi:hypothetical protein
MKTPMAGGLVSRQLTFASPGPTSQATCSRSFFPSTFGANNFLIGHETYYKMLIRVFPSKDFNKGRRMSFKPHNALQGSITADTPLIDLGLCHIFHSF